MVDNVKDIPETADNKATLDALDRARLARERREVEQRKRLDELHAQAAAAQAQRERRDDERRKRQQEQRARDDERRHQVEERKRAIWEASVSRREALLQRDRERTERLERARASRSSPRSAFAFGSSTPRLLEPVDSAGFFWAARSTNPIDQMNFFESFKPEAASTTNVMMASASLSTHSFSTLFTSDNKDKDENERSPQPAAWSSVARRRTDLVPTLPASRAPEWRSGETTPGSRPSSALSNAAGVVRRGAAARLPRPVSIAVTGVNTPRGGTDCGLSLPSTPSVSRDSTVVVAATPPSGEIQPTPRRPRKNVVAPPTNPADGKPPLQRKPKPSKEVDKNASANKSPVSAIEVTQKLVALQVRNGDEPPVGNQNVDKKPVEKKEEKVEVKEEKREQPQEKREQPQEKREQSQEKIEEIDMSGSMTGRRITTEEEAKAALAERRRKAREELEKQAELERQRLVREAEEEAERQRLEEERQRREEVEARELARLQRAMEEEKLRKAIEAQQQLEREEAERKAREEVERQARLREDEGKRKAAEEAERLRREEAEREEKERLARKQRVEAIMARTRLRKAEEDKKQQEGKAQPAAAEPAPAAHPDNGNAVTTGDLLGFGTSQPDESSAPNEAVANNSAPAEPKPTPNNGNVTADLLGMSEENNTEDKTMEQSTVASKQIDNSAVAAPAPETNNGNVHLPEPTVGHISANFIQTERSASEHSQKLPETMSKLIEDDFTAHNGHGANHDKPLTLTMQN